MNQIVEFYKLSQSKYDSLESRDEDSLYFTTDTLRIYKGSIEYTKSCEIVNSLPDTSSGVFGKIYVNLQNNLPYVFNGSSYSQLIKRYTTSIDESSSDESVPTSKAVKNYVDNSNKSSVDNIEYDQSSISLKISKIDKSESTVGLTGLVNNPTYDKESRKITLPISGSESLVIELGKDCYVESGSYNYVTKSIDLVLTNGQTVSVPAADLVKEYTAKSTNSVTIEINSQGEISSSVKISSESGNILEVKDDGLYVKMDIPSIVRADCVNSSDANKTCLIKKTVVNPIVILDITIDVKTKSSSITCQLPDDVKPGSPVKLVTQRSNNPSGTSTFILFTIDTDGTLLLQMIDSSFDLEIGTYYCSLSYVLNTN